MKALVMSVLPEQLTVIATYRPGFQSWSLIARHAKLMNSKRIKLNAIVVDVLDRSRNQVGSVQKRLDSADLDADLYLCEAGGFPLVEQK